MYSMFCKIDDILKKIAILKEQLNELRFDNNENMKELHEINIELNVMKEKINKMLHTS